MSEKYDPITHMLSASIGEVVSNSWFRLILEIFILITAIIDRMFNSSACGSGQTESPGNKPNK